MNALRRLFVEDDGAETVEYALVLGLMAIAAVVGLTALGGNINNWYNGLAGAFKTAPSVSIP